MNGNGEKIRVQTFFGYTVPATALAAATDGTATLRIESATDFYWFQSTYQCEVTVPAAITESTRIIPLIDVQMNVSGADRNLFQEPAPIETVFGTGLNPYVLPAPMVLLANSEVRFEFTNRDPRALTIQLQLLGLKDFGELTRAAAGSEV
jgi:hypothetical protein